jgi:hypothetical protein
MKFERYKKYDKASWALRVFRSHETEINSLYWSYVPTYHHSSFIVRNAVAMTPTDTPANILKAAGPDAKRVPQKSADWLRSMKTFQIWTRASLIVGATGALETYMQRAVLTALRSDPAAQHGKSKAIDGISWLKLDIKPAYNEELKAIEKGTWTQRHSAVRGLFGAVPGILPLIDDLDEIRLFRNSVGHSFGRSLVDEPDLLTVMPSSMNGITEPIFKKWLSTLSKAANALDNHLAQHIGEFEILNHFHDWVKVNKIDVEKLKTTDHRIYLQSLGAITSGVPGNDFTEQMIEHYKNA